MLQKVKTYIISLFHLDYFYLRYINYRYELSLSYKINKDGLHILREVFTKKVYHTDFPFNRKVIILDIGAHYGFFSIFAALHTLPDSKIYAFEPSKDNYFRFLKNIENDHRLNSIHPFHQAISGHSGERELSLGRPQNHSLYKNYIADLDQSELVQTVTLDQFVLDNQIEKIDFLKIDCEGSEHEILQNTSQNTLQKISVLSMELHDMSHCGFDYNKTLQILEKSGFTIVHSNLNIVKHQSHFNAKVVLVRK
ncbi:MAG: FkbM family methyltransferase [Saprospiraceae bacterium]|nr:FkbM family methyltransferase [Saprospiraceae bacterium]